VYIYYKHTHTYIQYIHAYTIAAIYTPAKSNLCLHQHILYLYEYIHAHTHTHIHAYTHIDEACLDRPFAPVNIQTNANFTAQTAQETASDSPAGFSRSSSTTSPHLTMSLARVSLGNIAPLVWPEGDNNNNNNNNDNNSPRQNNSDSALASNSDSTLVENCTPEEGEHNQHVYGSAGGDAMLCDLLTDAAAVGLMQAENRPPSGQW
jgi:hypothetical protein